MEIRGSSVAVGCTSVVVVLVVMAIVVGVEVVGCGTAEILCIAISN